MRTRAAVLAGAAAVAALLIVALPRSRPRSWQPSPQAPAPRRAVHRAVVAAASAAGGGGASAELSLQEAVRLMLSSGANAAAEPLTETDGALADAPSEPEPEQALLWPPAPPPEAPPPNPAPAQRSAAPRAAAAAPAAAQLASARKVLSPPRTPLDGVIGGSPALLALHDQAARLRFYVYSPPAKTPWCAANLTARFPSCKSFQWSGDWELIGRMRGSPQHTTDGDAADFYVVPFLSKCYYNYAVRYELRRMDDALRSVLAYLRQSPWWEAHPERHLFFFMSGVGAGIVPSWRAQIGRAVFVVAEGDRQADYFREDHDIVVPGKIGVRPKAQQTAGAQRGLMGVFRGSLDAALRDADGGRVRKENKLRRWLSRTLEHERGFIFSGRKSKRYVQEMDDSRFCIIPRGNTPWTRRFFDAVVRGCIPAVLSDPVAFPFERLLDFRSMTLKLPEQWTPRLVSELKAVNASALERLQRGLRAAWPAFVYTADGCAFDMLLLELAARKHAFFRTWPSATPNSALHFWSPPHGAFTLPGASKVGPSWGAGAEPH